MYVKFIQLKFSDRWNGYALTQMVNYNHIVYLRGNRNIEKMELAENGKIFKISFKSNVTEFKIYDIIVDEIGDVWLSDIGRDSVGGSVYKFAG